MLQVTPNGPWTKSAHPAVPVALAEVIADLRDCFAAGATGVHLHVRDDSGAETLDPVLVERTARHVREAAIGVGVSVEVGLTTGSWIVPDVRERVAMIREWEGVDCATVNVSERGFERVADALLAKGIGVDIAVWAPVEVGRVARSGLLPHVQRVSIEIDPGEPYFLRGDPTELAQRFNDALDDAGASGPRLTHGAKEWVWPLVQDAVRRGHDTRVGFEDSLLLPDGSIATNNAQLVSTALAMRAQFER